MSELQGIVVKNQITQLNDVRSSMISKDKDHEILSKHKHGMLCWIHGQLVNEQNNRIHNMKRLTTQQHGMDCYQTTVLTKTKQTCNPFKKNNENTQLDDCSQREIRCGEHGKKLKKLQQRHSIYFLLSP